MYARIECECLDVSVWRWVRWEGRTEGGRRGERRREREWDFHRHKESKDVEAGQNNVPLMLTLAAKGF